MKYESLKLSAETNSLMKRRRQDSVLHRGKALFEPRFSLRNGFCRRAYLTSPLSVSLSHPCLTQFEPHFSSVTTFPRLPRASSVFTLGIFRAFRRSLRRLYRPVDRSVDNATSEREGGRVCELLAALSAAFKRGRYNWNANQSAFAAKEVYKRTCISSS